MCTLFTWMGAQITFFHLLMYLLEALNSLPQYYEFLGQSFWTTILPFISLFIDIPLFSPHNFFPPTHTHSYPQSLRNAWVCKEGHRGALIKEITLLLAPVITYCCQRQRGQNQKDWAVFSWFYWLCDYWHCKYLEFSIFI